MHVKISLSANAGIFFAKYVLTETPLLRTLASYQPTNQPKSRELKHSCFFQCKWTKSSVRSVLDVVYDDIAPSFYFPKPLCNHSCQKASMQFAALPVGKQPLQTVVCCCQTNEPFRTQRKIISSLNRRLEIRTCSITANLKIRQTLKVSSAWKKKLLDIQCFETQTKVYTN